MPLRSASKLNMTQFNKTATITGSKPKKDLLFSQRYNRAHCILTFTLNSCLKFCRKKHYVQSLIAFIREQGMPINYLCSLFALYSLRTINSQQLVELFLVQKS